MKLGRHKMKRIVAIVAVLIAVVGGGAMAMDIASAQTDTPLTVDYVAPLEHDGSPFVVDLNFSEPVVTKPKKLLGRNAAIEVFYSKITKAKRLNRVKGRNGKWKASQWMVTVTPSGFGRNDVIFRIHADRPCTEDTAFCTGDGRSLSQALDITIRGPNSSQQEEQEEDYIPGPVRDLAVRVLSDSTNPESSRAYMVSWKTPEGRIAPNRYRVSYDRGCISSRNWWVEQSGSLNLHLIVLGGDSSTFSVRGYGRHDTVEGDSFATGPCKSADRNGPLPD